MQTKTKIAVIGGTGKSGKYLVKELLNQGFALKLLVRNPENFLLKNLDVEIVYGDVTNYNSVYNLLKTCNGVISTLGLGIPPSEPTIFTKSTMNVIQAMNELKIIRYILTTGINVDTPNDKKTSKASFATEWMKKNFPASTTNKQDEFNILEKSNIDWTLVRLPLIELTDKRNPIQISLEDCLGDKIGSSDLANFLIEQLSSEDYIKKSPFIYN